MSSKVAYKQLSEHLLAGGLVSASCNPNDIAWFSRLSCRFPREMVRVTGLEPANLLVPNQPLFQLSYTRMSGAGGHRYSPVEFPIAGMVVSRTRCERKPNPTSLPPVSDRKGPVEIPDRLELSHFQGCGLAHCHLCYGIIDVVGEAGIEPAE